MCEYCPQNDSDWGLVDPGIKPVVELLIDNGFHPIYSCQGGDGHAWPHPRLMVRNKAKAKVVKALEGHGYKVMEASLEEGRLSYADGSPAGDDEVEWHTCLSLEPF